MAGYHWSAELQAPGWQRALDIAASRIPRCVAHDLPIHRDGEPWGWSMPAQIGSAEAYWIDTVPTVWGWHDETGAFCLPLAAELLPAGIVIYALD